MKSKITEQTVIFLSIVKWLFLATCIGVIVGLATAGFLKLLEISIGFSTRYHYYYLALPAALFISAYLVHAFAPDAKGHGTEKVIEAVHKHSGKIEAPVVPVKLVATIITLAAGGSVGKEGPCAQIGSGLASVFADLLRFDNIDRKKLVICGISAGFASVFGTPIAGAIFGVEVLFIGSILYDVLLPSFIAGITSYEVSSALGIQYFHHPLRVVPVFSELFFLKIMLAGIFFGICSVYLIEMMKWMDDLAAKIKCWMPLKGVIGGIALAAMAYFTSNQYLGLGLVQIQNAVEGQAIHWYLPVLKVVFTSLTLAFEGSGGIVTPIFFLGATSGSVFATIFHLDPATFSAIGMVAVVAGAANTPVAASIMALEFFGPEIGSYAAAACVISFLMTGHRSVYPSQVLASKKSRFFEIELGKEIENVVPVYQSMPKTLIGSIMGMFQLFKKVWKSERKIITKE